MRLRGFCFARKRGGCGEGDALWGGILVDVVGLGDELGRRGEGCCIRTGSR